ncbi:hypothetical protein VTH06DRAFT_945 [Thermothelomyces fergusii]
MAPAAPQPGRPGVFTPSQDTGRSLAQHILPPTETATDPGTLPQIPGKPDSTRHTREGSKLAMADEKIVAEPTAEAPEPKVEEAAEPAERPQGWLYKGVKIGRKEIWYASPIVQLLIVSMVCFLCPGMFNALNGLGGGGQVDPKPQNDANTALYATCAVVSFFSGTIANMLGVKITMAIGGLGYCIYAASFLSYSHNQNYGFVVFAGAFLGLCAGMLWTAQGTIMMSYPHERQKGRYISYFWIIFNFGAVIGSLVPLGQNAHSTGNTTVTDGTYVGFIVLMILGAALALTLCNADKIRRDDGSKVILMKNPSWKTEIKGLFETITSAPWIILLFPMFFAANIFYTYQQNDFNHAHFNVRTRALNNLLYWLSQIIGAIVFGYALDIPVRRSVRAKASFVALFSLLFIIWGGGWAWQKQQVPREVAEDEKNFVVTHTASNTRQHSGSFFCLYILPFVFFIVSRRSTLFFVASKLPAVPKRSFTLMLVQGFDCVRQLVNITWAGIP